MDAKRGSDHLKNETTTERKSDRELVVTRTVNAPARIVYQAWTKPELFRRWWTPKSFNLTIVSCEQDVCVGGGYRLAILAPGGETPMEFFGKYLEVVPNARLVWTNEEAGGPGAITTVTFEQKDGATTVVVHDLHPSKEALDEAISSGSTSCVGETFSQLDEVVVTLGS